MPKNNLTIRYRVEQLERNYEKMSKKLEDLMENHIPSILSEMASLKTRVSLLTVMNIGAIVIGILFTKFL